MDAYKLQCSKGGPHAQRDVQRTWLMGAGPPSGVVLPASSNRVALALVGLASVRARQAAHGLVSWDWEAAAAGGSAAIGRMDGGDPIRPSCMRLRVASTLRAGRVPLDWTGLDWTGHTRLTLPMYLTLRCLDGWMDEPLARNDTEKFRPTNGVVYIKQR